MRTTERSAASADRPDMKLRRLSGLAGVLLGCSAVLTACGASGGGSRTEAAAAEAVVADAEMCLHLAGEFAGDRSERDRKLNDRMTALRCDTIAARLKALDAQAPENAALAEQIRTLQEAFR